MPGKSRNLVNKGWPTDCKIGKAQLLQISESAPAVEGFAPFASAAIDVVAGWGPRLQKACAGDRSQVSAKGKMTFVLQHEREGCRLALASFAQKRGLAAARLSELAKERGLAILSQAVFTCALVKDVVPNVSFSLLSVSAVREPRWPQPKRPGIAPRWASACILSRTRYHHQENYKVLIEAPQWQ